jgi:hypothetical protein
MQRTKRKKITFRKIGGGTFRLANGKIVKPNETFQAFPEDIPAGFKDVVKALEPLPDEEPIETVSNFELEKAEQPEEKESPEGDDFELENREDGKWNVVKTTTGKPINESPLEKEEAETLMASLVE